MSAFESGRRLSSSLPSTPCLPQLVAGQHHPPRTPSLIDPRVHVVDALDQLSSSGRVEIPQVFD